MIIDHDKLCLSFYLYNYQINFEIIIIIFIYILLINSAQRILNYKHNNY